MVSVARDRFARWATVGGNVLLAGEAAALAHMQRIARTVPDDVRVTMIVEAFSPRQVQRVDVPDDVLVTWLPRGEGAFDAAHVAVRRRGDRLGMAVHAWCLEWAPDADAPHAHVWLAAGTPPHIARMVRALLSIGHRRDDRPAESFASVALGDEEPWLSRHPSSDD